MAGQIEEDLKNLMLTDSNDEEDEESELVKETQLTRVIVKIRRKYKLKETVNGFSWRHVRLNDKCVIPKALNQGNTGLCIVYSLSGLFSFQRVLLETDIKHVKGLHPSKDYLLRVFKNMPEKDRNLQDYLHKLSDLNITDEKEFSRVGKKINRKQTKRFAIDWSYNIDPEESDGISRIKQAVKRFGGVIMEIKVFSTDKNGKPLLMADGSKIPLTAHIGENLKVNKRRKKRKQIMMRDLGHATFCNGWRYGSQGNEIFGYLNSYGPLIEDEGHGEVEEFTDINHVYVVQLCFDKDGF